jgi:hypothetical protein
MHAAKSSASTIIKIAFFMFWSFGKNEIGDFSLADVVFVNFGVISGKNQLGGE